MMGLLIITVSIFAILSMAQPPPTATVLVLAECEKMPDYQQWILDSDESTKYVVFKLQKYPGACIDCDGCELNHTPYIWTCEPDHANQDWEIVNSGNNNVLLQSYANGTCLQLISSSLNSKMNMQKCDPSNTLQQFNINNGYISSIVNKSLCITPVFYTCKSPQFSSYPYCNQNLLIEERVNDLLSRMTLKEKVDNLGSNNQGVPRLGVPNNAFHEALHGVLCGCGNIVNNNTGCPTSFPHALLLSATFNRSLWKNIGIAISTEARAFANQGLSGLFYWAPDINLFRDPRWGRGQEVPGEDPFLTSQYVMQYSYNMQYGEDTKYLKVISTAKHFADYDQE
eukprot:408377_1